MPARAPAYLPALTPARFRSRLLTILGDCRLLWMPGGGDTTTGRSFETSTGRVMTYDGDVSARRSRLGRGFQQSFVSASSQFVTTPDTADMSFNTAGTTDLPFSLVVLANVTDTAAARTLVSKWGAANLEWILFVTAADVLSFFIQDNSAATNSSRSSNAAITQGSARLFGASYDGSGGATAGNGMALFQSGAVIASTATNNGAYVAMEDLAAPVEIGSDTAHTANLLDGAPALVAVCAKNLSATDHASIATLCLRFYGVA